MSTDHYARPRPVDDLMLQFPAGLGDLLPPMDAIPDDYPHRQDWLDFQGRWFAGVLPPNAEMEPADGIDATTAGRHLSAIQRSFEPKHEHKMAAVAWLASRWFVRVSTSDGSYSCPSRKPAS
ncbi:hypothetical protein BKG82_26825 [Mycobacteroides chelonae]|uniref:Uncharacterized protein n=1 Tax=Mycobacteroides chelonae TaxID=1774 RepID=A0A1S1LHJ9_MYCCH|nr:hypothetical protein [Mycobacteroides chelonae]OHU47269.1 hypothetical protein BKG82_26825 [Mycobacteroides chelonae]